MKFIDLTGLTFGRLRVLERASSYQGGKIKWICLCRCGEHREVAGFNLKNGHTKSCGCLKKEVVGRAVKHGHAHRGKRTGTYSSWESAKKRCCSPTNKNYRHYGGRGITMCERWVSDFRNFLKDMGEKPKGLTLERVDNNGNYEPGNCKWIPRIEQALNKRSTVFATYKGETKTLIEWAKSLKVKKESLRTMVKKASKKDISTWIGSSVLDPSQNYAWENLQ